MIFSRARRLPRWTWVLGILPALAISGCHRKAETPPEEAAPLASIIHAGDPKDAAQFLAGFYGIEQNAWRWSAPRFAVRLHVPAGSAQSGAVLEVTLTVPEVVIQKLKTITLTPAIGASSLPPETYGQAGTFTYKHDVPANLLGSDPVLIDFQLDRSLAPTAQDVRPLGLVVLSVGLEPK